MYEISCIALKVLIKLVLTWRSKIFSISVRFVNNLSLLQVYFISLFSQTHFGIELVPFIQRCHFPAFLAVPLTPTHGSHYLMHVPDFWLSRYTLGSGINGGWVE